MAYTPVKQSSKEPMQSPYTSPSEVHSACVAAESFWQNRDYRITRFRDLVRQIDMRQRKKSEKYTSFEGNESGTFFTTMVQLLSKNDARHRIPLGDGKEPEGERVLKGQVERLFEGVYRDVDYRRGRRMDPDGLQETMAKFACSDGWVNLEVIRRTDKDKEPIDVRAYDTLDVFPQWGPEDLSHVVMRTRRSCLQIQLEYPDLDMLRRYQGGDTWGLWTTPQDISEVFCSYAVHPQDESVWYCVVINGQYAVEPYKLDWAKRIPMVVLPVNGLPYRSEKRHYHAGSETQPGIWDRARYPIDDWTVEVGRGIFFMNEGLYDKFNELWSMILDLIDTEGRGTYWKQTREGEDDSLLVGRGKDAVNALAEGEEVGRIPPPQLTPHVAEMLGAMAGMLQRGGISWQLQGQAASGYQSGFAINQLISAALYIAGPYIKGIRSAYRQLDDIIQDALRSLGSRKLTVQAHKENTFIEEEIDLRVLKGRRFFFDVTIEPGLPDDLAGRLNMAQLAKMNGLLDDWTILDEVIKVQDPETILARKDEQEVLNLPQVRLRRMAASMMLKGDMAAATAIMQELMLLESAKQLQAGGLHSQLMQMSGMLGMPNAGANTAPGTGAGGMGPGGGAPLPEGGAGANPGLPPGAPPGLPPEVLPPQAQGFSPEGQRALAANMMAGLGRPGA